MKSKNYQQLVFLIKQLNKQLDDGLISEEEAYILLDELHKDYDKIKTLGETKESENFIKKTFDL